MLGNSPPKPRKRGEPGSGWEHAQKAPLLPSLPARAPVVSGAERQTAEAAFSCQPFPCPAHIPTPTPRKGTSAWNPRAIRPQGAWRQCQALSQGADNEANSGQAHERPGEPPALRQSRSCLNCRCCVEVAGGRPGLTLQVRKLTPEWALGNAGRARTPFPASQPIFFCPQQIDDTDSRRGGGGGGSQLREDL